MKNKKRQRKYEYNWNVIIGRHYSIKNVKKDEELCYNINVIGMKNIVKI